MILLALVLLIAVPLAAGLVAGALRERHRDRGLEIEAMMASLDPGRFTGTAIQPASRKMRIAVTLFASPCDDCDSVVSQPCRLVPGRQTAVVDEDHGWACHVSRIVKGVAENKALYLALIAEWTGPLPPELEGLHANETPE
jgi:hypothetical protein